MVSTTNITFMIMGCWNLIRLGQVSDHQEQPNQDSRASNVAYPQQHDSIVSGPIIASGYTIIQFHNLISMIL